MRILLWKKDIAKIQGGEIKVTARLAAQLRQQGHDAFLVSSRGKWLEQTRVEQSIGQLHVLIYYLSHPPLPIIGQLVHYLHLFFFMIIRHVQAIHVVSIKGRGLPVIFMGRLLNRLTICYTVGSYVHYLVERQARQPRRVRWHVRLLNWTNIFICESDVCKQTLIEQGITGTKIRVVSNGVDTTHFSPDPDKRDANRRTLGLFIDGIWLVWCGSLRALKRPDLPVAALVQLAQLFPDLNLALVGDGPQRDEIAQLIADNGLTERVVITGWVADTRDYLRAGDFYVVSSDKENHSNSLMEAMACGLPSIATDVGGNGTIVQHRHNGLLVPPDDVEALATAITTYLTDAAFAHKMGVQARHSIQEHHSLPNMARAYAKIVAQFDRATTDKG
jgi:glycosyltransferase involved in cell wall biosynthesis